MNIYDTAAMKKLSWNIIFGLLLSYDILVQVRKIMSFMQIDLAVDCGQILLYNQLT